MKDRQNKYRQKIELITHNFPKIHVSEQYRVIRSNLLFASIDKEVKSIIITSPEPSDGKTTTSANLAIVMAQQGKRVLLIDADLRNPSIHFGFHLSNIEGLTSILTNSNSLENVILKTHISKLDIITCGPIPPNPSELLNSEKMEKILEKLKEWYDYIIFDTPPVLRVTDPQILANKCDGVVLVVSSGKTRKDQAIRAKKLLEKANSPLLGVIVNGTDTEDNNDYYS